jgi:GAF domain-containing protein
MVPLVVQGDTIGIIEVVDQKRSRQYSRQELRLAGAIAGQAAVAIKNAKLFAERRRSDTDLSNLRQALTRLTAHVPNLGTGGRRSDLLGSVATAVCDALGAIACVASAGGESAGAFGAGPAADAGADGRGTNASLVVARDPSGRTDLTLAVTLHDPPGEGQVELLDLVAAAAAALAAH